MKETLKPGLFHSFQSGIHERFIIDTARFQVKVAAKARKASV
jgi:hypothetical protein